MKFLSLTALLTGALLTTSAHALELSTTLGWYDLIDQDNQAAFLKVEYRHDDKLWVLTPIAGGLVTSDGAVYGYGGFGYDITIGERWYVFPNVAVGLYADGDGKDLGHTIEFQSGIEFGYAIEEQTRIGLQFHHLSNASIGDKNPGVETLGLTVTRIF